MVEQHCSCACEEYSVHLRIVLAFARAMSERVEPDGRQRVYRDEIDRIRHCLYIDNAEKHTCRAAKSLASCPTCAALKDETRSSTEKFMIAGGVRGKRSGSGGGASGGGQLKGGREEAQKTRI